MIKNVEAYELTEISHNRRDTKVSKMTKNRSFGLNMSVKSQIKRNSLTS